MSAVEEFVRSRSTSHVGPIKPARLESSPPPREGRYGPGADALTPTEPELRQFARNLLMLQHWRQVSPISYYLENPDEIIGDHLAERIPRSVPRTNHEALLLARTAPSVRRIYRDRHRRARLTRQALDAIRDQLPSLDRRLRANSDAVWAAREELRIKMQDAMILAEFDRLCAAAQENQTTASEVLARTERLSELLLERHAIRPLPAEIVAIAESWQREASAG